MLPERSLQWRFSGHSDPLITMKGVDRTAKSRTRASANSRRSREGATAVEFALIAFPFFLLLFAILEIALLFVTNSVLENAVIEAGRTIRTGEADATGLSAAQFKTSICNRMSIFSADCPARATVDVRAITQFRNASPPDPLANGTTFDASQLTYQKGDPGSLMLIRVWYKQPLFTPLVAQAMSKLKDGATILTATSTFRNEPFTAANPPVTPAVP